MTETPEITVVVCTRDRKDDLLQWLPAVLASASAAGADVLVVDNASTDGTMAFLNSLTDPALRYVSEPRPGLTHARRRAVLETEASAIVFVDDDVEVSVTWAEDMAAPILENRADGVAAQIVLAGHLDRPWLTKHLRSMLAEYNDVSEPVMVGASFAISRQLAAAVDWDDHLGPGALGMSDDVLFSLQAKAAGFKIVWAPGPPVVHHPHAGRLTRGAFMNLAEKNGRSHAYVWYHWLGTGLRFPRTRRLIARLGYSVWRLRDGPQPIMTDRQFEYLRRVHFYGQLIRERRGKRRYLEVNAAAGAKGSTPAGDFGQR